MNLNLEHDYTVKPITAEDTYSIRHKILRKGKTIESCHFNGDYDKDTLHFGLFNNSELIGVVSFMKRKHKLFSEDNQYQLRGMAVLETFQGKGLGNYFLNESEGIVSKNCDRIWCNARIKACNLYKKNDYLIIGDSFNIEGIGLHFLMSKKVP